MNSQLLSYVVIFDGVSVPEFTRAINNFSNEIPNWYSVLPQTVFVASAYSASELTDFIRKEVKDITRLLVLDAKTDRNGWLPKPAWEFLKNPRPAGLR